VNKPAPWRVPPPATSLSSSSGIFFHVFYLPPKVYIDTEFTFVNDLYEPINKMAIFQGVPL
jgi:hypothetical protein